MHLCKSGVHLQDTNNYRVHFGLLAKVSLPYGNQRDNLYFIWDVSFNILLFQITNKNSEIVLFRHSQ